MFEKLVAIEPVSLIPAAEAKLQDYAFFCDTHAAAGPVSETFWSKPNVHSPNVSAGRTQQAFVLLSQKVLANIETALEKDSA